MNSEFMFLHFSRVSIIRRGPYTPGRVVKLAEEKRSIHDLVRKTSSNFSKGFKLVKFKYRREYVYEGSTMSEMTTEILEQNLNKIVLVRLKGGKSLRGRLKGFDQHLNLVLEETEDTTDVESQKKLGLIIVRGDNVVLISPPPR